MVEKMMKKMREIGKLYKLMKWRMIKYQSTMKYLKEFCQDLPLVSLFTQVTIICFHSELGKGKLQHFVFSIDYYILT